MALTIDRLVPRRDGVVAMVDVIGHLPNLAYSVTGQRIDIDEQTHIIELDLRVEKSDGMAGQALKNVSVPVTIGRRPPSKYTLKISENGVLIAQNSFTI